MKSKTQSSPDVDDEELLERIRQYRMEDENGTLTHITNEAELREFFASVRRQKA